MGTLVDASFAPIFDGKASPSIGPTPFDPPALYVILVTFYPVVGPAAFARARQERPEYFGAGTIVGTHGDKLRLPDARVYDCIFGVSGPTDQWRWQVVLLEGDGDKPDDPWKLEPGPVTPIDESEWPPPQPVSVFLPLVAAALERLGPADQEIAAARATMLTHASTAPLEAAYARTIAHAELILQGERFRLDQATPANEYIQTVGQAALIAAHGAVFGEPILTPGEIPRPEAPTTTQEEEPV